MGFVLPLAEDVTPPCVSRFIRSTVVVILAVEVYTIFWLLAVAPRLPSVWAFLLKTRDEKKKSAAEKYLFARKDDHHHHHHLSVLGNGSVGWDVSRHLCLLACEGWVFCLKKYVKR